MGDRKPEFVMLTPNGGLPTGYWPDDMLVKYVPATRISALEAENARLREALEAIRDGEVESVPHPHFKRMCKHQRGLEMDDCWECIDAHINAALGDTHDS